MATKTLAQLIPAAVSPSSNPTLPTKNTERILPVKFVERFLIDGPGWNAAERSQGELWRSAAQEMAADIRDKAPGWTLTMLGQTASGKTMLGKLLLRCAQKLRAIAPPLYTDGREPPEGPSLIYWPTHDWRQVEAFTDATFLMLDEIGRGDRSGKEWQRLMDLLNYRVERRLFTVVTANLTFRELQGIDAAIASRLGRNGGKVFQSGAGIRPFEDRK